MTECVVQTVRLFVVIISPTTNIFFLKNTIKEVSRTKQNRKKKHILLVRFNLITRNTTMSDITCNYNKVTGFFDRREIRYTKNCLFYTNLLIIIGCSLKH
jgi:hypothetical protein